MHHKFRRKRTPTAHDRTTTETPRTIRFATTCDECHHKISAQNLALTPTRPNKDWQLLCHHCQRLQPLGNNPPPPAAG